MSRKRVSVGTRQGKSNENSAFLDFVVKKVVIWAKVVARSKVVRERYSEWLLDSVSGDGARGKIK